MVRPAISRTRAISSALFSLGVSHSLVPSLYELMRWSLAVTEFKSFSGMAAWCLRPIIAVPGSAALYFDPVVRPSYPFPRSRTAGHAKAGGPTCLNETGRSGNNNPVRTRRSEEHTSDLQSL